VHNGTRHNPHSIVISIILSFVIIITTMMHEDTIASTRRVICLSLVLLLSMLGILQFNLGSNIITTTTTITSITSITTVEVQQANVHTITSSDLAESESSIPTLHWQGQEKLVPEVTWTGWIPEPTERHADLHHQLVQRTVQNASVWDTLTSSCRATAQVRLWIQTSVTSTPTTSMESTTTATHNSNNNDSNNDDQDKEEEKVVWMLQAVDDLGNNKTVGGDEFYVSYQDDDDTQTSAAAFVTDLQDGTYQLDFVTLPYRLSLPFSTEQTLSSTTHHGTITIHFQYTCGVGSIPVPLKASWPEGGALKRKHSSRVPRPPIRLFQPPRVPNLSAFDFVAGVGDSLMNHFLHENSTYHRNHTLIRDNVGRRLSSETYNDYLEFITVFHDDLLSNVTGQIALVLGSAAWDLIQPIEPRQGRLFQDHLDTCRRLIAQVRTQFPQLTVMWKSVLAMHIHRVRPDCYSLPICITRMKYLSTSRVHYLYRTQKAIMEEMQVPMLDLYEASYLGAEQTRPGDTVHYTTEYNQLMQSWFYND
jgi:hypothetical protein